ncbi:MAG: helicase [Alphaproteobacteria bacterium CG_4_10_14_0_2_um_filter_63_37]|nr:MAG: helicase [Alphaproteobacteria bacterium CG_4_10_14_0_2_um_filter_63_37]
MSLPEFTFDDIESWLGPREVAKGKGYVAVVRLLEASGDRIEAEVRGTARRPYRVTVTFREQRGGWGVMGFCTCPVGYNCKHVAATLLAFAERSRQGAASGIGLEVSDWIESLRSVAPGATRPPPAQEQLLYVLAPGLTDAAPWDVTLHKVRLRRDGSFAGPSSPWNNIRQALLKPPRFVDEDDLAILGLLWRQGDDWARQYGDGQPLKNLHTPELMRRMLDTGRLCVDPSGDGEDWVPLDAGTPRPGEVVWRAEGNAPAVRPAIRTDPPSWRVVSAGGLWYLDLDRGLAGVVETPHSPKLLDRLLQAPPLPVAALPAVAQTLAVLDPKLPLPQAEEPPLVEVDPRPVLLLTTVVAMGLSHQGYDRYERTFDVAIPSFAYETVVLGPEASGEYHITLEGTLVRVARRRDEERLRLEELQSAGLSPVLGTPYLTPDPPRPVYALDNHAAWPSFMLDELPRLRALGWEVGFAEDFRQRIAPVESWEGEVVQGEEGWFDLDMGIVVEGRRFPLPPLLYQLFKRDPRLLDAQGLAGIDDEEVMALDLPDGGRVALPAGRIKPVMRTLIDLFDTPPGDTLRLSRWDAARLAELGDQERWQFKGMEDVAALAERLRQSRGVTAVAPPEGFMLELRPYQREGLAWLQFLREQDLAGILADDMGLGKTAQTLAHILTEKRAGRLDRPALVVLPTSLLFNWRREAARCAPDLRVLGLRGPDRAERFAAIAEHDVVLTTYPLVWRDIEALAAHSYHLLILDEAQTVKNAGSKGAQAVRRINARHRLCLTGTPLENHLGELWSQFDFLLPGFLGDAKRFAKQFRNPIEKQGDRLRGDLLARRVAPFMLRRSKSEVASDLPPKNVIVRSVELEGSQRDLYETVRSAMDAKVREAIAAKGLARSHILILDALLKLRQVCCDPRLLKTTTATRVKGGAKLDLLMEMLPELVEEGRRILVFSQFVAMLDLIAQALDKVGLPYLTLTGQTKDREAVVDRFQAGAAPVLLVSLKAGGVGLNLTAADTVIHFDPWWNPAAENQATDRAHRIGQTQAVFVYKLVAAGSIEEKILALQEHKAALAAGVLGDDATALGKFGPEDLQGLFEPLPEG